MDFEPKTNIIFSKTGVDDNNKYVYDTIVEYINTVINSPNCRIGETRENSFQRGDGFYTIRVDHSELPYFALLRADTVAYLNAETLSAFWIIGNVLAVEWKNPDCSFVRFKIDYFMTFQQFIDWDKTHAYIEREHVKEDWSSSGNPLFANIGPAEDFRVIPDTPIYHWNKGYVPSMTMIQDPYNDNGEAVFDGQYRGGMFSSLQVHLCHVSDANEHLTKIAESNDCSINNVVSVEGFPVEWMEVLEADSEGFLDLSDVQLNSVHIEGKNNKSVPNYNNAKCWSAPYTIIRLMSSDGEQQDFNPQWFGNDVDSYTLMQRVCGCGGMFAGAAATFRHKNEGIFNWETWENFMVMIKALPKCPWTADGYTDWSSVNMTPTIAKGIIGGGQNILNGAAGVVSAISPTTTKPVPDVGAATMSVANAIGNTAMDTINIVQNIGQERATGATIRGGGGGNLFDIGQKSWGFKVVYYQAQPYLMTSIDNFFSRFGYRVNRLKKLNLKNRPYWTFIKTAECHVLSKPNGGMTFIAEKVINAMFNSGVTLWTMQAFNEGRQIGDFSNPEKNKGVAS